MSYLVRLFGVAAVLAGFLVDPALAGSWAGTHPCSAGTIFHEGTGRAAAMADRVCLYPNARPGGHCNVEGSIASCYSTGNKAICWPHETDDFECGGGAILTCKEDESKVVDDKGESRCVKKNQRAKVAPAKPAAIQF